MAAWTPALCMEEVIQMPTRRKSRSPMNRNTRLAKEIPKSAHRCWKWHKAAKANRWRRAQAKQRTSSGQRLLVASLLLQTAANLPIISPSNPSQAWCLSQSPRTQQADNPVKAPSQARSSTEAPLCTRWHKVMEAPEANNILRVSISHTTWAISSFRITQFLSIRTNSVAATCSQKDNNNNYNHNTSNTRASSHRIRVPKRRLWTWICKKDTHTLLKRLGLAKSIWIRGRYQTQTCTCRKQIALDSQPSQALLVSQVLPLLGSPSSMTSSSSKLRPTAIWQASGSSTS